MMEILRTLKKSRGKATKDGVLPASPPPQKATLSLEVTGVTKSQGKNLNTEKRASGAVV